MLHAPMRAVVCLAVLATPVAASPVRISQDDPRPGLHHEYWEDAAVPARIHFVRVDLTSVELHLVATSEPNAGIKTSTFATRKNATVAINGGPFLVAGYRPRGLAMGDMQMWAGVHDDDQTYVLHFRNVGARTIAALLTADEVTDPGTLPIGTEAIVSGRPLLVRNGIARTDFDGSDAVTLPYTRAPRTAIGLSSDGYKMLMVVVDGWQTASAGMTAGELASFLRARGAHDAIGLDIGASSTMALNGGAGMQLLNAPSDGVERAVANHIAVQYGPTDNPGALTGAICKTSVSNCDATSERIFGVTVTLDNGDTSTTTTTEQLYNFPKVTPRYACVTARKTGYRTTTACKIVEPGQSPPTYNSLVLPLGTDPVDAGVPDASEVPVDADDGGDPGRPDAGNPDIGGGGGGCCNTGGDHPPVGAAVLVAVVAFAMGRRRGTKA